MRKIIYVVALCTTIVMAGCKKGYVSPLETPSMTKAAEDRPYSFDYDQINNDVIDSLQDKGIYTFVKSLSVSGNDDAKEIQLDVDVIDDVSEEALELFLTDATKAIIEAANTQDLRIDSWTKDGFGNLFDMFSYKYRVTCGDTTLIEESLKAGDSVPLDPEITIEQVMG